MRILLSYMVNAGEAPAADFMRALAERLPQYEDELMTIAQQLEQKARMEGKLEGRMEGIQIGEEKGRMKGKLEVAQQLLTNGMDRNTVMKMTGLTADDLAQIRH